MKLPVNFKITDLQYLYGELANYDEPFEIQEAELQLAIIPYRDSNTRALFTNFHADIFLKPVNQGGSTPGTAQWVDVVTTKGKVSGYVSNHNGKMLQDINIIYFENERIKPNGIITMRKMPVIHYGDYTFYGSEYS